MIKIHLIYFNQTQHNTNTNTLRRCVVPFCLSLTTLQDINIHHQISHLPRQIPLAHQPFCTPNFLCTSLFPETSDILAPCCCFNMIREEQWCPQAAMKAYLCTLHLCKDATIGAEGDQSRLVVAEPECMEFISALAAGNGAQLIVEIASKTTPLTLALAVAAKQTGGQFVCVLPTHHCVLRSQAHLSIRYPDLKDTVRFVSGDPGEILRSFDRHVDFVVINDSEFDEHLRLLEVMMRKRNESNGRGSVVVERLGRLCRGSGLSFGEVVRGREGVESVSLPVSGGMELTRIKNGGKSCNAAPTSCGKVGSERRRCKRFHVIVENR